MGLQDTPADALPQPKPRFRHSVPFRTAALSLEGTSLVGLDADGVLVGWDARTARLRYRTPVLRQGDVPHRLSCSPDGRFVAVSRRDHVPSLLRVFQLDTGAETRRFERGFSPCFSPDGEILAATDGPLLRRWAMKSGAELPGLGEAGEDLKWAAYSPKGDRLAVSSSASSTVSVWDLPTRRQGVMNGDSGLLTPATSLAFSPDGETLAIGNVWGLRFRTMDGALHPGMQEHEEYSSGPLRFSAGGRQLCSLMQHRRMLCWNPLTGDHLHTWSAYNTAEGILEVSEGGDQVIWVDADGLRVERIPRILGGLEVGHVIVHASFTADGQALTADNQGTVKVWDPATQTEVRSFRVPATGFKDFASNGRWAIYGGGGDPVRIWDLLAGKELLSLSTKPYVTSIALSPDAKSVALGHVDGALSLWSLADSRERTRIHQDLAGVGAICWSADGTSLAWGDERGAVVLAEGTMGREAVRFSPRDRWGIRDLQFHPDGKTLVSEDAAGNSHAYDGTLGKEPTRLQNSAVSRFRDRPVDRRWVASGFLQSRYGRAIYSGDGRYAVTRWGGKAQIWEAPGEK